MKKLLTIDQLDEWMTENCYNDSYGIGNRNIHEGYGLAPFENLWTWYYTERGNRNNIVYFQTEQEAVTFAFNNITNDKSANRHLVGFFKDKAEEGELLMELESRSIGYWKDKIPFGGLNDMRTRVFVFGCDIKKVLDLQNRFCEIK